MPSPFPLHGIFASLGQEEWDEHAAPKGRMKEKEEEPVQPVLGARGGGRAQGQVAVDIYEVDGYVVIRAPIAGVRMSDLDIEIAENVLTIRGVRRQGETLPADQYYLQECYWGEFSRSVTLPFPIDAKKVRATFNKENILKILIPKEDKVKIVRISEA